MRRLRSQPRTSRCHSRTDEIIEAIKHESIEAPIGDEARQTLADLANDPVGLEKRLAHFRA